jgi:hypothetical protein
MLYREIMAVCSHIHTKHINTLRGQNVELLKVMYSNHWAFPNRHHAWIPSCLAARHTRITTQQFVNILHALQIQQLTSNQSSCVCDTKLPVEEGLKFNAVQMTHPTVFTICIKTLLTVLSPTKKETSYSDRRFCCSYILFIIIIGGMLVLFIYI